MLVTIEAFSSAPCSWCCQSRDEVVVAQFHDGLKGAFCKKHFWEALNARVRQQAKPPERREAAKSGPGPSH